jgi:uncharacterized lipoprotein YajG
MRCPNTRSTPTFLEYPRCSTVSMTVAALMLAASATASPVMTVVPAARTSNQTAPLVPQSISARVAASEDRPEFAMGRVKPTVLTPP